MHGDIFSCLLHTKIIVVYTVFTLESIGCSVLCTFLDSSTTQCPPLSCMINHYRDVIIGVMVSQLTSLTIVYLVVYWGADQRKHQSSASLAFVRGIHRWPVNSTHKWPVTQKIIPFDRTSSCTMMLLQFSQNILALAPESLETSSAKWNETLVIISVIMSEFSPF